jgi:hypothetical protein
LRAQGFAAIAASTLAPDYRLLPLRLKLSTHPSTPARQPRVQITLLKGVAVASLQDAAVEGSGEGEQALAIELLLGQIVVLASFAGILDQCLAKRIVSGRPADNALNLVL